MESCDATLASYQDQSSVGFYEQEVDLQPVEECIFSKYVKPGANLLDIGIGAGRTTRYLGGMTRYTGVDYSDAMILAAKKAYPELNIFVADARDLRSIMSSSMEVVLFSFNGLDCLPSIDDRSEALHEISRVLVPGGIFICSCHNSRFLIELPLIKIDSPVKSAWRVARALTISLLRLRTIFSRTFVVGSGFFLDKVRGLSPIWLYSTIPLLFTNELADAKLDMIDCISDRYPSNPPSLCTRWFYYVSVKR